VELYNVARLQPVRQLATGTGRLRNSGLLVGGQVHVIRRQHRANGWTCHAPSLTAALGLHYYPPDAHPRAAPDTKNTSFKIAANVVIPARCEG